LPNQAQETQVPLPRDSGRKSKGTYGFDLGRLKLSPGERLTYRIEATDNDAVSGNKRGASRTHVLKIYSAAEHRREAAQRVEALWEKMIVHQADRMEGPDRDDNKDGKQVAAAQRADQTALALVAEMRDLARKLAGDRDSP